MMNPGRSKPLPSRRVATALLLLLIVDGSLSGCGTSLLSRSSPQQEPLFLPDEKRTAEEAAGGFERPPLFRATDLLPKELLENPEYKIDEIVRHDGKMYRFRLVSPLGEFSPVGDAELRERIHEILALRWLYEKTNAGIVAKAAGRSLTNIALAPVYAAQTVGMALWHPRATWGFISGVPGGIGRAYGTITRGMGDAKKAGEKAFEGDSKPARSGVFKGAKQVADYALKRAGYNKKKRVRDWQKELNIDPYTTNTLVLEEINRIASLEGALNVGFKFIPGIGLLGFVGDTADYLARARKLALYSDPKIRAKKHYQALLSLGVEPALVASFMTNDAITPTTEIQLIESLGELFEVEGKSALVELAARSVDRNDARFFGRIALYLADLHAHREPLTALRAVGNWPLAFTETGAALSALPVDYLTWTKEVSESAQRLRGRTKKEGQSAQIRLDVGGRVSPLCRQRLEGLGFTVVEGVKM